MISALHKQGRRAPKLKSRQPRIVDGIVTHELSDVSKTQAVSVATFFGTFDIAGAEIYDPAPSSRLPEVGSWAMITRRLPAIEGGVDKHFRVGRCFYLERSGNTDSKGFGPRGIYKVKCHSPWGDVSLFPYEYSTISIPMLIELWGSGELIFHPTAVDPLRLNQVVFYARSRGLSLADAAVLALGTITAPVGWFEPRADLAEECEEMERRIHARKPPRRFGIHDIAIKGISP